LFYTAYKFFKFAFIVFSLRALSNCNNEGYFNPNIAKPDINTFAKLYLTEPLRCSGIFSNSFLTFFNIPCADKVFLNFNLFWDGFVSVYFFKFFIHFAIPHYSFSF